MELIIPDFWLFPKIHLNGSNMNQELRHRQQCTSGEEDTIK